MNMMTIYSNRCYGFDIIKLILLRNRQNKLQPVSGQIWHINI